MLNQIKKGDKLERLKRQCPPKTYRSAPVAPSVEQPFVPSRALMFERMKQEALKTESVKDNLKIGEFNPTMSRQEKRKSIRNIVRSAISDIRDKMTQEIQRQKGA